MLSSSYYPSYWEAPSPTEHALLIAARASFSADRTRTLRAACELAGQAEIRNAARANRCEALVGLAVREAVTDFDPDWNAALAINAERVAELAGSLAEAIAALERAGCVCAVIEGGSTVFSARLSPAAYGAGDFDVLVARSHWEASLRVMQDLGYQAVDRAGRVATTRAQFQRSSARHEHYIEVGHRAFDRTWVPLRFHDQCADWLARRTRGIDPAIPVLRATDALVVAAFHASLHSYVLSPALRLQVDIDRAARHPELDWNEFVGIVQSMGIKTRTYASLMIASSLLHTPVPEFVLAALAPTPGRWRALASVLSAERVLAGDSPKLRGLQRVKLDYLLSEHGAADWLSGVVLPDASWVTEHFGSGPVWQAHLRRYLSATATVARRSR